MKHSIPRVLLHDHLDGSYPLMTVLPELFRISKKPYPFKGTFAEQCEQVKTLFNNVQLDIVERFSNTTGVMQSRETLALAGEAYTRTRAEQGFLYCEATIAPQYHMFGGMKEKEVIGALIEGIKRAESEFPQIEVNLLFTIGREVDLARSEELIRLASECDRNYVVGVGLVCDEAGHPPEKHMVAFRLAKKLGLKISIHAGEWVATDYPAGSNSSERAGLASRIRQLAERDKPSLLRNIRTAIFNLGADRVGHAIPLAYDNDLVKYVVENRIGIELCPGSNYSSGLIPNTGYLKIRDLLQSHVLCSLNPDDDLFLPQMPEVIDMVEAEYSFSGREFINFEHNAWMTRFGRRKHDHPAIWD
ncbi:MAG: hypothetical protein AAB897_00940 [Patescibacteria group bacterium]